MGFHCGYQLVIFGCLIAFAQGSVDQQLAKEFYDVNEAIGGSCNSSRPALLSYVTDSTKSCLGQRSADAPLLSTVAQVNDTTDMTLSYEIKSPSVRVYNIWCVVGGEEACRYAIGFEVEANSTDEGLDCKLRFGDDGQPDFVRPDKVEWLLNGSPLEPNVSKTLETDDFVDEDGAIKSFSFALSAGEFYVSLCMIPEL